MAKKQKTWAQLVDATKGLSMSDRIAYWKDQTCPDCGGTSKGAGIAHTAECPNKKQVAKSERRAALEASLSAADKATAQELTTKYSRNVLLWAAYNSKGGKARHAAKAMGITLQQYKAWQDAVAVDPSFAEKMLAKYKAQGTLPY